MKRRWLFALLGGSVVVSKTPAAKAAPKLYAGGASDRGGTKILCPFCQETRRKAELIEKGIRPPLLADPMLKNEPISIMPGMIVYVSSERNFRPAFEINLGPLRCTCGDLAKAASN